MREIRTFGSEGEGRNPIRSPYLYPGTLRQRRIDEYDGNALVTPAVSNYNANRRRDCENRRRRVFGGPIALYATGAAIGAAASTFRPG